MEHPSRTPSLSVVIPAYNEARRIGEPLASVHAYLRAQPYESEVIVIDDGSDDGTLDVVRDATSGWDVPVRAFRYAANAGKGYAIKFGVARARGDRILFTDADLSTPIEQTTEFMARLDAGADVVIGSRKTPWADIRVHQPWYRERLGMAYTWLVRRSIADVSDVTCGFKAFRAGAARDLFARIRLHDWSFDAELMLLVRLLGYRLDEVPVRWDDRAGTRVRLLRDVVRSLYGILRIRANAARGLYRTSTAPLPDAGGWEWIPRPSAAPRTPAR